MVRLCLMHVCLIQGLLSHLDPGNQLSQNHLLKHAGLVFLGLNVLFLPFSEHLWDQFLRKMFAH